MDNASVRTLTDDELTALHQGAADELERRRPKIDLATLKPGHMTLEQEKELLAEICRVVERL